MSQKSINELNLNSITISNSNYSNSKGYTAQSNTLETNNAGALLVNGLPISSGGGGGVDDIVGGDGIDAEETSTGVFTITNTGVTSLTAGTGINLDDTTGDIIITATGAVAPITAGAGINVDDSSGDIVISNTGVTSIIAGTNISVNISTEDVTVTCDINPADFQTQAGMASYSTTTQANALYQPIGNYQTTAGMASYSTTTQANALYQPIGNYLTETTANGLYLQTDKIARYQLEFNTSVLTANSIYQKIFTIPDFIANQFSVVLMTPNTPADNGIIYVCNVYWETTTVDGGSTFVANIANVSAVDGGDHLRAFSVLVINQ